MGKEQKDKSELNEKQMLFCRLYVSKDYFGSGVLSYCEAYNKDPNDPKEYAHARHNASMLLAKENICKQINDLLDSEGLNDSHVDKRLLFLINQNEDKHAALGAIKEYNKLRERINNKVTTTIIYEQPLFNDIPKDNGNK